MNYRIFTGGLLIMVSLFISCKKEQYENFGLLSESSFGDNPGNLDMYYYQPENSSAEMPLVVVMHGCSQNAADIAELTEWNKLADRFGFYVLYPEQKTINNASRCFNWFREDDQERGKGESQSIKSMIGHLVAQENIDDNRVFVSGVSAGGAMTTVMLSCYPEMFTAGAVFSGGPYKAAENALESASALSGNVDKSPEAWGNLVRSQNAGYSDPYPRLLVIHGEDDNVVDIKNADELIEQWSNVHGIAQTPTEEKPVNSDVQQKIYKNNAGDSLLIYYKIANMGHKLSVDPGDGQKQGGGSGTFAKDKDFYSIYWVAAFFGLVE